MPFVRHWYQSYCFARSELCDWRIISVATATVRLGSPSKSAKRSPSFRAASAPKGASPLGQELPLFACMEMAVQGDDGKPVLPLFLDRAEAQQAVEDAMAADAGDAGRREPLGIFLME